MSEKTHAELERPHYNEVKTNPLYAMEGLMDVRREEWEMNMPAYELPELVVQQPEKPWNEKQWGIVQQLQGKIKHLERRFNEHLDKPKRRDRI